MKKNNIRLVGGGSAKRGKSPKRSSSKSRGGSDSEDEGDGFVKGAKIEANCTYTPIPSKALLPPSFPALHELKLVLASFAAHNPAHLLLLAHNRCLFAPRIFSPHHPPSPAPFYFCVSHFVVVSDKGKGKWYKGRISRVVDQFTFDVTYDDGTS